MCQHTMMHLRFLGSLLIVMATTARAQEGVTGCEQAYGNAKALYDDGRLFESLHLLDSLVPQCREDKDQQQRILFLKAVIEAQNDSVKAMRRTMEALFRNDRRYVLKPYDPLIVQLPAKAEIFSAYEQLHGGRGLGTGLLGRDHGQWRAGVHAAVQRSALELGPEQNVFDEDPQPSYEGRYGWQAGADMRWDVIPNLAVRASAGWSVMDYSASSDVISYRERVSEVPVSLGVEKKFWIGEQPWVPHVFVEGTWSSVVSCEVDIARSGDGLRYLQPKSLDRSAERRSTQASIGGGVGVGRKLGHTVVILEGGYRHALRTLTLPDVTYTETELLTNYYWLDRSVTLSAFSVTLGVQYVLKYHRYNRVHR